MPRMVVVAYSFAGMDWEAGAIAKGKRKEDGGAVLLCEHHMLIAEKVENTKKWKDQKEYLWFYGLLENHYE